MKSRFIWLLAISMMSLLLASCGAPAALPTDSKAAGPGKAPAAAPAAPAPAQPPSEGSGASENAPVFSPERMVIYSSSIVLMVEDTQVALEAVTALARDGGGYVVSASTRWDGDHQAANMVIRVLAKEHDRVLGLLRRQAVKVENENVSSRDVTEEFVDLDAQVRNLEATEAQYVALLARANSIDEILRVQQRLTEVRGQIERFRGRMNYLKNQADLATITVDIRPALAELGTDQPFWNPFRRAAPAWRASLEFLQAVADVVVIVVVFLWWLIPLAVVAVVAWRRWRPRPTRTAA